MLGIQWRKKISHPKCTTFGMKTPDVNILYNPILPTKQHVIIPNNVSQDNTKWALWSSISQNHLRTLLFCPLQVFNGDEVWGRRWPSEKLFFWLCWTIYTIFRMRSDWGGARLFVAPLPSYAKDVWCAIWVRRLHDRLIEHSNCPEVSLWPWILVFLCRQCDWLTTSSGCTLLTARSHLG